jgi:hypothetical protein
MALAIPGGAPGYDYDKEFGNNITHLAARTSQRLRVYIRQTPKVKGSVSERDFSSLAGFREFGEWEFRGSSHAQGAGRRRSEAKYEPQMCNCTSGNLEILRCAIRT